MTELDGTQCFYEMNRATQWTGREDGPSISLEGFNSDQFYKVGRNIFTTCFTTESYIFFLLQVYDLSTSASCNLAWITPVSRTGKFSHWPWNSLNLCHRSKISQPLSVLICRSLRLIFSLKNISPIKRIVSSHQSLFSGYPSLHVVFNRATTVVLRLMGYLEYAQRMQINKKREITFVGKFISKRKCERFFHCGFAGYDAQAN